MSQYGKATKNTKTEARDLVFRSLWPFRIVDSPLSPPDDSLRHKEVLQPDLAEWSTEPSRSCDQEDSHPNDNCSDDSRDNFASGCEAFSSDGYRHEHHRPQVHDSEDQENRHQPGAAITATETEPKSLSPSGAAVS